MKRIFHDIDQSTDEWLEIRRGLITSSNFTSIIANSPGSFGNPAKEYAMRVAIEGKTNRQVETFSNNWMDRGTELEPDAREAYEAITFRDVFPGGFIEYGAFGTSPDGLTADGMIEIKCPKYSTHMQRLIKGGYDTKYQWQIRGQMWIADRDWCDFVSYCPEMPQNKQLYIFRVDRDQEEEQRLIARLNDFEKTVQTYINLLEQ